MFGVYGKNASTAITKCRMFDTVAKIPKRLMRVVGMDVLSPGRGDALTDGWVAFRDLDTKNRR